MRKDMVEEHDWLKAAREQEAKRFAKRRRPGEEDDDERGVKIQRVADVEVKEEKKSRKTFSVEQNGKRWRINLVSDEYDQLDKIPGVKWSGMWLETTPMQTELVVDSQFGAATLDALEKLGYKGNRTPVQVSHPIYEPREFDAGIFDKAGVNILLPKPAPPSFKPAPPKTPSKGKTYKAASSYALGLWEIHLRGNDYDDLSAIPHAVWHGGWTETMPMQTEITVAPKHGPEVLDALEKLGYVGTRP